VTQTDAAQFVRKYSLGKSAAGKKHEAKSVDSRLRSLKAIFGEWFKKKLHLIEKNPFAEVERPALDRHEVKYVSPADLEHFCDWLGQRYPGWPMPQLFFQVKAMTGCRLADLCSISSADLRDGRIIFSARVTKNRSERVALLPEDIYAALEKYKGKAFLWEPYPLELRAQVARQGAPTHRLNPEFSARRLYLWVVDLMQTYQKETGRDLSSHDFRRAAFTRAAEAGIDPNLAADAFDVSRETMSKYYIGTKKTETSDEVLGGLADKLRIKRKGERGR
jgi:integrase